MGQDIRVVAKATSKQGYTISLKQESRAKRSVINSGREYKDIMFSILQKIAEKYNIAFMTKLYSSRDFENTYKEWVFLSEKGEILQSLLEEIEEGDYEAEFSSAPEWFREYESDEETNELILIDEYNQNVIKLSGFSDTQIKEIAQLVFNEFKCLEYIQFLSKKVISENGVEEISSFSEEVRLNVFGLQPEYKNITSKLFWWDEKKLAFQCHKELMAIYGSTERAIEGYNRGEFTLWETGEGRNFYCSWRDANWNDQKRKDYETFLKIGLEPIEGKEHKGSPLYKKAQEEFKEGAFKYKDGNIFRAIGETEGSMTFKVINVNGEWIKKDFSMNDFYPLGIKVIRKALKVTKPEHSWAQKYVGEEREVLRVKVEDYMKNNWKVYYDNKVVYEYTY